MIYVLIKACGSQVRMILMLEQKDTGQSGLGWKGPLKMIYSNPQFLFSRSLIEFVILCSLYLLSLPFPHSILGCLQMLKHCQSISVEVFLNHHNWLPADLQGGVPSYMYIFIHPVIIAN